MKNLRVHSIVLTFLIIQLSCSNPTAPPPTVITNSIVLKQAAVSCTEAFIKVTSNNISLPVRVTLNKDSKSFLNFTLTKPDTVIVDDSLQPGEMHIYQTSAQIDNREQKSDTIQVKTLNLSSDNYTWQKYTFGNGASSILNDVAIIDGNNIWAVGEIYINDSSENGYTTYNAAHWNGSKWELKKIYYYGNCSAVKYPPLYAIYVFSDNKIAVTNGGSIGWLNGDSVKLDCGINHLLTGKINKIWGTSSNDFYVVGNGGNIAHYQNGSWIKIESGTDLDVLDIWADENPFTNKKEIICTLGKGLEQPGPWSDLIRINEDFTVDKLNLTGLGQIYGSLWFKAGIRYYIVGDGLYEKTFRDTTKWVDLNKDRSITTYYMSCIRGNGLNDIVAAGAYGEFLHFNGISWKSFMSQTFLNSGTYFKISIKGNIQVAVGYDGNSGVILLGYHQ